MSLEDSQSRRSVLKLGLKALAASTVLGSAKAQDANLESAEPKDLPATMRRLHADVLGRPNQRQRPVSVLGAFRETAAQAVQYKNNDFAVAFTEGDHETVAPDTDSGPMRAIQNPESVESVFQGHGHPVQPSDVYAFAGVTVSEGSPEIRRVLSAPSHQDFINMRLSGNSMRVGDSSLLVDGVIDPGGCWLYRNATLPDLLELPDGREILDKYLEAHRKLHNTLKQKTGMVTRDDIPRFFGGSDMFRAIRSDNIRTEGYPINRVERELRMHWYPNGEQGGHADPMSRFMLHRLFLGVLNRLSDERQDNEPLFQAGFSEAEIKELQNTIKEMKAVTSVSEGKDAWQEERKTLMRSSISGTDTPAAIQQIKARALKDHGARMEFLSPAQFGQARDEIAKLVISARTVRNFNKTHGIF